MRGRKGAEGELLEGVIGEFSVGLMKASLRFSPVERYIIAGKSMSSKVDLFGRYKL